MTRILALSGKKQSGKGTSANHLHGRVLMNRGDIKDFCLNEKGDLFIETQNSTGEIAWGQWDITRRDEVFLSYAYNKMWPYVKIYSFADTLKELCYDLFDVPAQCLWGTNDEKNTPVEHLRWENMPGISPRKSKGKSGKFPTEGAMTARQFMQYFGTEVMRKMYGDIWARNTIKRIQAEGSELAVIADLRFPNECEAVLGADGYVVRLTRNPYDDQHESETALDPENYDQSRFSYVINNGAEGYDISDLCTDLDKIYREVVSQ